MMKVPTRTLYNGVEIPAIGYGVAMVNPGEELGTSIRTAVEAGYRFFDCAPAYENEAEVGAALKTTGISREELFISTKLPNTAHAYEDVFKAFDESRAKMGVDYFDEYLIHWPLPLRGKTRETWRAFEKLYKDGLVRVIGLSNFLVHHIQPILDDCEIKPMVNELECNPYYTRKVEREFCAANGIQLINWFPLGGPPVGRKPYPDSDYKFLLEDEVVKAIAKKHERTPAQTVLRWAVDSNLIPIPKSSNPTRIQDNINIFDFSLSPEDRKSLEALNQERRFGPNPDEFDDDEA